MCVSEWQNGLISFLVWEILEFVAVQVWRLVLALWRFDWAAGELNVEVGGVDFRAELRDEGSLDLFNQQVFPVQLLEPRVVLNLLRPIVPETFSWILYQQFLQQILQSRGKLTHIRFTFEQSGFLYTIDSKSSILFSDRKGGNPVTISWMRQPRHHQSTSVPCPSFFMISGARYSGVPQIEVAASSCLSIFESPKSVSLM